MTDHASLHNHSHYSVLDGYAIVPEYVKQAKELGLRGLGLTDHGTVSGLYEFLQLCNKNELVGVPGCEMYVAPINPLGAKVQEPVFYGPSGKKSSNDVSGAGAFLHMTIWAVNNTGFYNLLALSAESYDLERQYKKPRIDLDLLAQYSDGLVVSTGCPSSEISTRFRLGQDKEAYDYAGRLLEIFGRERLFVEIMDHEMNIDLERELLPKQLKLAKDLNLELLATNDCHYAFKENATRHEEMLCSQSGSVMRDKTSEQGGNRFAFNGTEYYLKSGDQMAELFPDDKFPRAVTNSVLVAEMAQDIHLDYNPGLRPRPRLENGETAIHRFQREIEKGLRWRYGSATTEVKKEAKRRVTDEAEMFIASNFIDYFLVVQDYINEAKKYSTFLQDGTMIAPAVGFGRGSVGGCITAYLLGISEIDPIRFDLLSERFMTPGRGETYRITYDDGSYEDVLASEIHHVVDETGHELKRYTHQLAIGNTVASPLL